MPNPSFRVSDEFMGQMKEVAESRDMSLSDFIRTSVERAIENNEHPSDAIITGTTVVLQEQIQEKDEQIKQLHQLIAMGQKNVSEISQQFDRTAKQLEDTRRRRSWRFWERRTTQPA